MDVLGLTSILRFSASIVCFVWFLTSYKLFLEVMVKEYENRQKGEKKPNVAGLLTLISILTSGVLVNVTFLYWVVDVW